jgi:hypothetical protein
MIGVACATAECAKMFGASGLFVHTVSGEELQVTGVSLRQAEVTRSNVQNGLSSSAV